MTYQTMFVIRLERERPRPASGLCPRRRAEVAAAYGPRYSAFRGQETGVMWNTMAVASLRPIYPA